MKEKLINFQIYRYHLLPLESNNQIKLFDHKEYSYDEIKKKKNIYFGKVLDILTESKNDKYPLKLIYSEGDYYLFKIAQKKNTTITQNFETLIVDNEPYVYILFNNNPSVQKIAISQNIEAFTSSNVVAKNLKKIFRNDLEQFGLNIEIEALFDQLNFWSYVKKHKGEITYVNFQYIKPNLGEISKSLSRAFRNFTENTNSHESNLIIKAPPKGVLENINKKNEEIKGLVEYTSEGAGSVKLKVKGVRKVINTDDNPVILEIDEAEIEGETKNIINIFKSIVD